MRILVVDNDRSFLRTLEIVLTKSGHHVRSFSDPRKALRFMDEEPTDDIGAILVDYIMPELTGIQLVQMAGDHLPDRCHVVLVTGHAEDIPEDELAQSRIDVLCTKTLGLAKLLRVINDGR